MKKIILTRILPAAAFIGLIIILHMNLLFPWQQESRKNKQAILEYVNKNYPGAKILSQSYDYGFKLRPRRNDVIDFKWNDIEFYVSADDGKIVVDGYPEARTIDQFEKIIQDGFMKPRGIDVKSIYSLYNVYRVYPYIGSLQVELRVVNQGLTPQEVGWLFDFYKYWKTEGDFLKDYQVEIYFYGNKEAGSAGGYIIYKKDSEFANEDEFYSAFILTNGYG